MTHEEKKRNALHARQPAPRPNDNPLVIDAVNHPKHYARLTPEPIDVIEAWRLGFCLGNAVKYIARAGHKSPEKHIEDLEKAAWCVNREIDRLRREAGAK